MSKSTFSDIKQAQSPLSRQETNEKFIQTTLNDESRLKDKNHFKGDFSSMLPSQKLLDKLNSLAIKDENDNLIEERNRIDVHDLEKWLDSNKSRMSSFI